MLKHFLLYHQKTSLHFVLQGCGCTNTRYPDGNQLQRGKSDDGDQVRRMIDNQRELPDRDSRVVPTLSLPVEAE